MKSALDLVMMMRFAQGLPFRERDWFHAPGYDPRSMGVCVSRGDYLKKIDPGLYPDSDLVGSPRKSESGQEHTKASARFKSINLQSNIIFTT